MGGAFGHLNHPYDLNDLSFNDLGKIINQALTGRVDYAQIKTDAINLMFSFKRGIVIAARNKSHLKNFGNDAMNACEVMSKFAGRDIGIAYTQAMHDLQNALNQLTDKQRKKVFSEGRKWMSIEVMSPLSRNIINYGDDFFELRLHGTFKVGKTGEKISQINKADANMLEGMLKQKGANIQKTYVIKDLTKAQLRVVPNFIAMREKYFGDLAKIMRSGNVKSNDSIYSFKEKKVVGIISEIEIESKDKVPFDIKDMITDRWINGNKSNRINVIIKGLPDSLKGPIKELDKNVSEMMKKIIDPLQRLFLKLGSDVMLHLTNFMVHNPLKTIIDIKDKIERAKICILGSGKPELISKLNYELERLRDGGGISSVVPEEGITFFYKDGSGSTNFLKLTGIFAPINQIVNITWRV